MLSKRRMSSTGTRFTKTQHFASNKFQKAVKIYFFRHGVAHKRNQKSKFHPTSTLNTFFENILVKILHQRLK